MPNPVSPSERTHETIEELHHTTPVVSCDDRVDITKAWKCIKATVCGDYEIPDRVAAPIRFRAKDAPVGSYVCLEGSKNIKLLAIEPTISLVEEGQLIVKAVVNTTGSSVAITHGPKQGSCLFYDRRVVTNPLEFPTS